MLTVLFYFCLVRHFTQYSKLCKKFFCDCKNRIEREHYHVTCDHFYANKNFTDFLIGVYFELSFVRFCFESAKKYQSC